MNALAAKHDPVATFVSTCRRQCELLNELLACFDHKEQAIRLADVDRLQAHGDREVALLRELRAIDLQRTQQQDALMERAAGNGNDLVERLASPQREQVQPIVAQLRTLAAQVRNRSTVLRSAAEALSAHLGGVVRSAWGTFEQHAVYERSGRVATAGANMGIDVKS